MPVSIFIKHIDQMILEFKAKSDHYQTTAQIDTLEKLKERILKSHEN